jgi:hypothetical protein
MAVTVEMQHTGDPPMVLRRAMMAFCLRRDENSASGRLGLVFAGGALAGRRMV